MKKLKERLNVIVNEISKSDKGRTGERLPRIAPSPMPSDERND
jgi:hypothetical protein